MPKVTPDDLREFGTLSGYLCSQVVATHPRTALGLKHFSQHDERESLMSFLYQQQADKIPEIGDEIRVGNYVFTVTQADERRIIEASLLV